MGWADVATKHDVEPEVAMVRNEMHAGFVELRAEMHAGFAGLRTEIAQSSQRVLMWTAGIMLSGFVALFVATIARG